MLYYILILFTVLFCDVLKADEAVDLDKNTLYLVHVLFRHGERTPLKTYPKDIYKEEDFPFKYGQLRNKGRLRMYNLGLSLKNHYQDFLRNINTYNNSEVMARSSPLSRTRMSCEAVMAALHQSNPVEEWNPAMKLQQTACNHRPRKGNLMFVADQNCAQVSSIRDQCMEADEHDGKYNQYKDLFKYLSQYSGWKISTPSNVTQLFDILKCQNEMDMELPKWSHDVFPSPMDNLSLIDWDYIAHNDDQNRYNAGVLLKTIIDETDKKINNTENYKNRKLSIYCCHDTNIIAMLGLLGIYDRKVLPYAATLIVEVHRINEEFKIKVLYQAEQNWQPKLMTLPSCPGECTVEKFKQAYHRYYGTKDMC